MEGLKINDTDMLTVGDGFYDNLDGVEYEWAIVKACSEDENLYCIPVAPCSSYEIFKEDDSEVFLEDSEEDNHMVALTSHGKWFDRNELNGKVHAYSLNEKRIKEIRKLPK